SLSMSGSSRILRTRSTWLRSWSEGTPAEAGAAAATPAAASRTTTRARAARRRGVGIILVVYSSRSPPASPLGAPDRHASHPRPEFSSGGSCVQGASGRRLPGMPGLRILVVDDEPDLGDVLADLLTAQGHEVQLATDGRGALAVLDLRPIDLVISDVLMHGMDGPALHREIQRRHPALIPRFIWMSGAIPRESQAATYVAATGAPLMKKP